MNLKGMEAPIQFRLTPILLPALTLVFFMAPRTGLSANTKVLFGEISSSKCISSLNNTFENTASAQECAFWCILENQCQYFSYCNGSCHMHRSLYDKEIKDYDCKCSSYILLSRKVTDWQKVFEMTPNSFKKSPIYLYWDKLPIEKVEFRLKKASCDKVIIFNGKGTNSISWFQKDKIISKLWSQDPHTVTFNANYPEFTIANDYARIEAKRESGDSEEYDISSKTADGTVHESYEAMVISVILK